MFLAEYRDIHVMDKVVVECVGAGGDSRGGNECQDKCVRRQNDSCKRGLEFPGSPRYQKSYQVGDCDRLKGTAQLHPIGRAEEIRFSHRPKEKQNDGALDGVSQLTAITFCKRALGKRKRDRNTHHQHETGPDAVVKPQPEPGAVIQFADDDVDDRIVAQRLQAKHQHAAADDPKHGESAEDIE